MYNMELMGNILIQEMKKTEKDKNIFVDTYMHQIKNKRKVIADWVGIELLMFDDDNTDYYDMDNWDNLYARITDLIQTDNDSITYIIINEFSDIIKAFGKEKTYELFDYISVNYKKHKIKYVISSQHNCFSPTMKKYANTFIKFNTKY